MVLSFVYDRKFHAFILIHDNCGNVLRRVGGERMDWVELHNVEFGDCTVLGGNGQMLMIDCGSLNSILGKGVCKFEEYAKRLTKRYAPIEQRHGMISHFHKDHVNGFSAILQEEPLFFQRIYLPPAPQDNNGNPLLLEFALLVYTFVT